MFNLIKMNFYRLVHSKMFYLLLIAAALLGFTTPVLTMAQMAFIAGFEAAETGAEVNYVPDDFVFSFPQLYDILFIFGFALLVGIAAACLANTEDRNGYVKNIAGQIQPRGIMAVAKLPALMFQIISMCVIAFFPMLWWYCKSEKGFIFGKLSDLFMTLGIHLLLYTAFGAFVMFLTFLTRKTTVGILISLAVTTDAVSLLYTLINMAIWKYLKVPMTFDISDYALDTYMSEITYLSDSGLITKGIIAGAVYLVLFTAFSFLQLREKDV